MWSVILHVFELLAVLFSADNIAIPDFAAGAMENWGLITYLTRSLLYSPEESSARDRHWVATVVAHELAHQVSFILFGFIQLLAFFPFLSVVWQSGYYGMVE
jgi:hypothetical protein